MAKSFEQFRAVFRETLPTMRVDPGFPLTVFAARDTATFRDLLPLERQKEGATRSSGIFLPAQGKNIILLRMDIPANWGYHAIYHEYVHMAMNLNFEEMPLWLSEGLADLYGFARIDGGAGFGLASPEFLETLKASSMIPLATLMAVTRNSPFYIEQGKSRIFYAQSWALTHYLVLGDKGARAKQLIEFLRLIKRDIPEQEAFVRCFGDLDTLQRNLENYVRSDKFYFYPVKAKLAVKESRYASRELPPAESIALRGDLMVRINRLDEARALLERALQLNSRSAAAHEGMGLYFLRLRDMEQSQKHFTTAAELDPRNCLTQYYAAELAHARNNDYKAAENYLRKALAINPQFVPACHTLSRILLLQGLRPSEALEYAMKAADLEPAEASHWINVGEILLVLARDDEARRIGERMLKRARNQEEYAQAEALLAKITKRQTRVQQAARPVQAAPRPNSAAGELETPLGEPTQKAAGVVRLVQCSHPAVMDLVLDSDGKQQRMRAENHKQVQVRGQQSEFNPCKDLQGLRVQIEFSGVSGREYSGVIRAITIEK